jgi:deazaflavin-dependent oxidoreductase (nitroreductase family)
MPARKPAPGSVARTIETEFFRMLNRLAEPRIRAGCASPRLAPGGLVVVEITGRRTGRRTRVPLAATRIQGHVVVSTFRGRRSQWVKNLVANPDVRLWRDGSVRRARAVVLAPDHRPRGASELPAALRWVLSFLTPYTYAGWAFAVLAPQEGAAVRPDAVKRGGRRRPRRRADRPRARRPRARPGSKLRPRRSGAR